LDDEDIERIHFAIKFLAQFEPLSHSTEVLEMMMMHTAYLINNDNVFENNINIEPRRLKLFTEHVDMMNSSDISAWCRKLYEFNFWRFDNFVTVNIIYNWLRGTLSEPKSFL
jgi:hypothetical protein